MQEGIKRCRLCGSEDLIRLFSIGDLYISTFPSEKTGNIGKSPLTMVWCNNCTLVQLEHTAPQELMYSGHYWYRSGLNKVIINDLKEIAEVGLSMVNMQEGDIVLDIGANDGTLLSFVPKKYTRVGCEPASNLAEEMKKNCEIAIADFWDYEKYKYIFENKKAKLITAIGMFYDMDNPNQFIADAAKSMHKDGIFIAQLMTSKPMLENNDVGNICHEHIEYYSYGSLKYLFEKNGLEIFKVEENSINGGSYRLFARHLKNGSIDYPEDVTKEAYMEFFKNIEKNKKDCLELLKKLKSEGKKVYGYGASTKGNTILQYYGLNESLVKGITEISKEKFGKFAVGSGIPIVEENLAKKDADYFLVLPYAFRDSFVKKEKPWIETGGNFIFCTPKVEVVGKEELNGEETKEENKQKKALILGVTGQDGSYMAELLLEKGYEVHGLIRKSATGNTKNINHILDKIILHKGDLADVPSLYRVIKEVNPDELYNFADQDHVSWSYALVDYASDITGAAVGRILEIIKQVHPKIKFLQPVSSNILGFADGLQDENSPLHPTSPYACAKAYALHLVRYYREVFGLHASTTIFYNHESPRRGEEYVTRKITKAVAKISKGLQEKLYLGDISIGIDFGYAKDYVEASWNILQLSKPDDFLICTAEIHTIKQFVEEAFRNIGIELEWEGKGVDEKGYDKTTRRVYVEISPEFFRPSTTGTLKGNPQKARNAFNFQPKVKFKELVKIMFQHDLKELEKQIKLEL